MNSVVQCLWGEKNSEFTNSHISYFFFFFNQTIRKHIQDKYLHFYQIYCTFINTETWQNVTQFLQKTQILHN